jgi:hypothetical protein
MTYHGHVKNGMVVLDDPVTLPEGVEVRVEVLAPQAVDKSTPPERPTLGQVMLKYAGKAVGLPPDAAQHHNHYLYGTPADDPAGPVRDFLLRYAAEAEELNVDSPPDMAENHDHYAHGKPLS